MVIVMGLGAMILAEALAFSLLTLQQTFSTIPSRFAVSLLAFMFARGRAESGAGNMGKSRKSGKVAKVAFFDIIRKIVSTSVVTSTILTAVAVEVGRHGGELT